MCSNKHVFISNNFFLYFAIFGYFLSWLICSIQESNAFMLSGSELQDNENDIKIFMDVVKSVEEWNQRKQRKWNRLHSRVRRDEEVVCYGDLGCFRDEGPFDYLDMLPHPPEIINTQFLLYTRKNQEEAQIIVYNNISSIKSSNFNASFPLKIIIHGFSSSCSRIWPREMRLSFLAVEDVNVICVDWHAGAVDPNYVRAAVNTRLVGKQVALLINNINDHIQEIASRTHMIGFSLGAHVAGFAGSDIKNLSRISGLDPAGPMFEGYDPRVRLDKSDANYVDVIHSNGESLIIGGLGSWESIGHADFYPNGGRAQKGCQNLLIGGLYDFMSLYSNSNETYRYLCNHRRAYQLFTNSISPRCKFLAFPCDDYQSFDEGKCFSCGTKSNEMACGQMGYYSDKYKGRGNLYLHTMDQDPFCANQYKVKVRFTGSRQTVQSYGHLQLELSDANGLTDTVHITENADEYLESGGQIEKLIVVHPAIEPVEAALLYMAYDGWFYSGRFSWSIEKLELSDAYGNKKSYCKQTGRALPSGIPIRMKLEPGDCVRSGSTWLKTQLTPPTTLEFGKINQDEKPKSQAITTRPTEGDVYHVPAFVSVTEEGKGTDIPLSTSIIGHSTVKTYIPTSTSSMLKYVRIPEKPSFYGNNAPRRRNAVPITNRSDLNKRFDVVNGHNTLNLRYIQRYPVTKIRRRYRLPPPPPPPPQMPFRGDLYASASNYNFKTENKMVNLSRINDALTILKVKGSQNTSIYDPDNRYMILHKLANGEDINLKNLEISNVNVPVKPHLINRKDDLKNKYSTKFGGIKNVPSNKHPSHNVRITSSPRPEIRARQIQQLSKIAKISISKGMYNESDISIQPPVITTNKWATEQRSFHSKIQPGIFRQNKISPSFKTSFKSELQPRHFNDNFQTKFASPNPKEALPQSTMQHLWNMIYDSIYSKDSTTTASPVAHQKASILDWQVNRPARSYTTNTDIIPSKNISLNVMGSGQQIKSNLTGLSGQTDAAIYLRSMKVSSSSSNN